MSDCLMDVGLNVLGIPDLNKTHPLIEPAKNYSIYSWSVSISVTLGRQGQSRPPSYCRR